jgi:hypothetical protein
MKNSEETNKKFKAVAVVLIIGLTIVYNSNIHLDTWQNSLTKNFQTDSTQILADEDSQSRKGVVSFTTKLIVTGIKQLVANN